MILKLHWIKRNYNSSHYFPTMNPFFFFFLTFSFWLWTVSVQWCGLDSRIIWINDWFNEENRKIPKCRCKIKNRWIVFVALSIKFINTWCLHKGEFLRKYSLLFVITSTTNQSFKFYSLFPVLPLLYVGCIILLNDFIDCNFISVIFFYSLQLSSFTEMFKQLIIYRLCRNRMPF